jgi:hypothetical protein
VEDDWLEAAYEDAMSMAGDGDLYDEYDEWLDDEEEEEGDAALAGDQHPA